MRVEFHPEAEEEFEEAIDFYEYRRVGLGFEFASEVYATLGRILSFPKAWPRIGGEVRRSLLQRFPYGILYSEEGDTLYVVAVMHLHRDPDYWKSRI